LHLFNGRKVTAVAMPLGGTTGSGPQSLVTAFNAANLNNAQLNKRAKTHARAIRDAQYDP
jgi:hypothetical protein